MRGAVSGLDKSRLAVRATGQPPVLVSALYFVFVTSLLASVPAGLFKHQNW